MSVIEECLKKILSSIYGKDVRQSIHDGIKACYDDVSNPTLNTEALQKVIDKAIEDGKIANLTIGDGTITKEKLDPEIVYEERIKALEEKPEVPESLQRDLSKLQDDLRELSNLSVEFSYISKRLSYISNDVLKIQEVSGANPLEFLLNKTWLTGYAWSDTGKVADKRYTTTDEVLTTDSAITIKNPDTSKYYISLGYFSSTGSYANNRVDNFSSLNINAGSYFKLAIKFIDNRTLTDSDVEEIKNDFFNQVTYDNIIKKIETDIADLSDRVNTDIGDIKLSIDYIKSELYRASILEDADWLCGYSFYISSPYVNADERYFVSRNKIKIISGITLKNPDTSKYLYALGFYNDNDSYLSSDYTNAETYTFTTDCNVRIAIKKQDNSTMTESEMSEIVNEFVNANPTFNIVADLNDKVDAEASKVIELESTVESIKSEIYRTYGMSMLENTNWMCNYSFYASSPYVHTDNRYFVSKDKIKVINGSTFNNPDTSKYLYALGFYNTDDSYISSDYSNQESYTFTKDCYVRIAIKKQDDSTMTESEMDKIVNEFLSVNQTLTLNIISDLIDKFSDLSNKVDEISPYLYDETVITVGEGGDYSSLKEALDSISGNSKTKPYVVKVLKGTYDLPSTEKHFGLKNYVRIVGEDKNKCVVRNLYSDTVYDSTRNTFDAEHYGKSIEYASIENLTVICKGGKAPIHIDTSFHADGGLIEIKNCILKDLNTLSMSNIPIRSNNYNAGGINVGMLGGRSVKVYDTISNGSIYAHNQSNQSKPCYFEVNHCQFACTTWGDLGSNQEDVAAFNNCHFDDLYFGCSSSLSSTKVKTILHNNDIRTVTSYGSNWTDGNGFAGWNQVFDGKCRVIENNIHMEVFNKSDNTIKAGSLVELVSIRGVNLNGVHVKEYDGGLLMGYAMENIAPNDFGLIQYRNDVEIPLLDGINVGDEIEYTNGNYQKKTTGKTVGYYIGSAPYFRYKMRLNVK